MTARIEPVGTPYIPESMTDPYIVACGSAVALCFLAMKQQGNKQIPMGFAVIKTKNCLVFQSGYPNDEARGYHPLAAFGLDTVTIGRVKDSEWVKEVTDQNKKGWPNTDYSAYEHYIYSFKETTFEMIAQDVSITVSDQSLSDVKKEITEWLESVIE